MIAEKNLTYTYVGNVANGIADEASYLDMAKGSIAVVRMTDNKNEESALSTTNCRIIQRKANGEFVFSPVFNSSLITSKSKLANSDDVNQVSFFGWNGVTNTSTGFGTITAGDTYSLSITLNNSRNTYNNTPELKVLPYIAITNTQVAMAKGYTETFLRMFSTIREPNPIIKCERVSDTTSIAALTGSATIYKVQKGSKTVYVYTKAAAGDATLTASTASVTLGDVVCFPSTNPTAYSFSASALGSGAGRHIIYIGTTSYNVADAGSASQNGDSIVTAINAGVQATASNNSGTVTVTYNVGVEAPLLVLSSADDSTFAQIATTVVTGNSTPVKYVVGATATTAASFDLDVKWQGESGYYYEGTNTGYNIGIATISGNWGLKLSGIPQPFDPLYDTTTHRLVNFDITSGDFGTVVEYKASSPKVGNGTYQSVGYLEVYSQFKDKSPTVMARPRTKYRQETEEFGRYDIINFVFKTQVDWNITGVSNVSYVTINIATKKGLAYDGLDTVFAV